MSSKRCGLADYFLPQAPSIITEDVFRPPDSPVLLFFRPSSTALLSIDNKHECETKTKSKART
jgi:hypothetical protein